MPTLIIVKWWISDWLNLKFTHQNEVIDVAVASLFRNCCMELLCKKATLKNSENSNENTYTGVLSFHVSDCRPGSLLETLGYRYRSVNFVKFKKNSTEHCEWLLLLAANFGKNQIVWFLFEWIREKHGQTDVYTKLCEKVQNLEDWP